MKFSELFTIVDKAVGATLAGERIPPIWIWSPPGVGKSDLVRQVRDKYKIEWIDFRGSQHDPVDLKFPKIDAEADVCRWIPTELFPTKGKGIFFMDELAQSVPMMQNALLQVALDRMVGQIKMGDFWYPIAASNRHEDKAGAHQISTALRSRFVHLDLSVDHDEWQAWARDHGISSRIRAFLHYRPSMLHSFKAMDQKPFPCPRTWAYASQMLDLMGGDKASEADVRHLVAGCVGDGTAAEYAAFVNYAVKMPDPKKVLASPEGADVPSEPATLYALCLAMSEYLDKKTYKNYIVYMHRVPAEYGVLMAREASGGHGQDFLQALLNEGKWIGKNQNLVLTK